MPSPSAWKKRSILKLFCLTAMNMIIYALTDVSSGNIVVFAYTSGGTMTEQLLESVRSKYGAVAESSLSSDNAGVKAVAEAFGYTPEELTSIPAEANMGLSCGNPTATAHIRPGEVVVDLGSGGGLDVFLASKMVGAEGRAIGVDMTPEMIDRARANAKAGGNDKVCGYFSREKSDRRRDTSPEYCGPVHAQEQGECRQRRSCF